MQTEARGRAPGNRVGIVLAAVLPVALDPTMVAIALPVMAGELHGFGRYTWPLTAYLLAVAVVMPIAARLAERPGRKAYFQAGLVIWLLGSVCAALCSTFTQLLAFRVAQGVGAGVLLATAIVFVAELTPVGQRRRRLGAILGVLVVGAAGGLLVGGLLTDHYGWQWCFFFNLPLGMVALFLTTSVLTLPRPSVAPRLDLLGWLLLTGVVCCAVFLIDGADRSDPTALRGLVGSLLVLAGLFILVEFRASRPILPWRQFADRRFGFSAMIGLLLGAGLYGALAGLPLFGQFVNDTTAFASGLFALPLFAGVGLAAVVGSRVIVRGGRYRACVIIGTAVAAVGFGLLTQLTPLDTFENAVFLGLTGVGIGLSFSGLIFAVRTTGAPALVFAQQLGSCLGVAVFGALVSQRVIGALGGSIPSGIQIGDVGIDALSPRLLADMPPALRTSLMDSLGLTLPQAFVYGVPLMLLAFLCSFFLAARKRRKVGPEPLLSEVLRQAEAEADKTELAQREQAMRDLDRPDRIQRDPAAPVSVFSVSEPEQMLPLLRELLQDDESDDVPSNPVTTPTSVDREVIPVDPEWQVDPDAIEVLVRQIDGAPALDAVVTLTSPAGREAACATHVGAGRFTLQRPEPGSYVLIASLPGFHPYATVIDVADVSEPIEIELSGESGLTGTVCQTNGVSVANATLTLTNARGKVIATGQSGRDGSYEFVELVPGSYTMTVTAASYRTAALSVRVPASGRAERDVELIAGGKLRGTVRIGGFPLPAARVSMLDGKGRVTSVTTTDSLGSYSFTDIPEGSYTVVAAVPPPDAEHVRIEGGERHDLDLSLEFAETSESH